MICAAVIPPVFSATSLGESAHDVKNTNSDNINAAIPKLRNDGVISNLFLFLFNIFNFPPFLLLNYELDQYVIALTALALTLNAEDVKHFAIIYRSSAVESFYFDL